MKAIILDGQLKSALCTVRSLGEKGVVFSVGAERKTAPAFHSKFTKETFLYTSPLADKEAFITEIEKEAKRLGEKPLLYAFSDATWVSLVRHQERLAHVATLVIAPGTSADTCFDKSKTLALATELGIPIPKTHALDDLDDIAHLSKDLKYPAIVKPRRSAYWKDGKGYVGTVRAEHTPAGLTGYVAKKFIESGEMPLIQDFVIGDEYGVELLVMKGDVRASVVHRRIRSLSPRGGASVLKETVEEGPLSKTMKKYSYKLAEQLRWDGVMMVEFKVDKKNGEPLLMEVNGRFWGSLPLSVFAGVDFPYLYYELAQGKLLGEISYLPHVKSRHLLGDLHHLMAVFFAKDQLREMVYPPRFKALKEFLGTHGVRYDVIQKNDMLPFVFDVVDSIARKKK